MTVEEMEERQREEVKASVLSKLLALRTGLRTATAEGALSSVVLAGKA